MELRHLRYFITVAKELSFSRAADELYISQPALSRQIKNLEDELGVALFLRHPNGLILTEAGMFFLEQAKDILHRSHDVIQNIQVRFNHQGEILTIGYFAVLLPSFLGEVLSYASMAYPKMTLNLREMMPAEQVKALRNGEIDIAFPGNPVRTLEEEFEIETVKRLPIAVVLPEAHRLAKHFSINLADLARENFIGVSETNFPGVNERVRETCRKAGFTPKIYPYADTPSSVTAFVASHQGIGLMPIEAAALHHPEVVFIPLHYPRVYARSVAMWRKETPAEPLSKFLKILLELKVRPVEIG